MQFSGQVHTIVRIVHTKNQDAGLKSTLVVGIENFDFWVKGRKEALKNSNSFLKYRVLKLPMNIYCKMFQMRKLVSTLRPGHVVLFTVKLLDGGREG